MNKEKIMQAIDEMDLVDGSTTAVSISTDNIAPTASGSMVVSSEPTTQGGGAKLFKHKTMNILAKKFADKSNDRKNLQAVKVGKEGYALASDGYKLGVSYTLDHEPLMDTMPMSEESVTIPAKSFSLPVNDNKMLLLKGVIAIGAQGEGYTLDNQSFEGRSKARGATSEGFPEFKQIIPTNIGHKHRAIALDPKFLKDACDLVISLSSKHMTPSIVLYVPENNTDPIVFDGILGDEMVQGLIMPKRMPDGVSDKMQERKLIKTPQRISRED